MKILDYELRQLDSKLSQMSFDEIDTYYRSLLTQAEASPYDEGLARKYLLIREWRQDKCFHSWQPLDSKDKEFTCAMCNKYNYAP